MLEVLVERVHSSLVLSVVFRVHFQCYKDFLIVCVLIRDWLPQLISPRLSCEYLNEILYMILESWHMEIFKGAFLIRCKTGDKISRLNYDMFAQVSRHPHSCERQLWLRQMSWPVPSRQWLRGGQWTLALRCLWGQLLQCHFPRRQHYGKSI